MGGKDRPPRRGSGECGQPVGSETTRQPLTPVSTSSQTKPERKVMAKKSVFCIVNSEAQAGEIVNRLRGKGFSNNDISALFPDKTGTRDFVVEKGTKAPEGAATGAGTGAVLGGTLGWLAGVGALAIPGVGPFVAAGPIAAALSGAAVGGAVGGIAGSLIGMGIPEYEAKRYEGKVKQGGILLSVHTENSEEIKRVKEIFEQAKAQDIATAGEAGVGQTSTKPDSRWTAPVN